MTAGDQDPSDVRQNRDSDVKGLMPLRGVSLSAYRALLPMFVVTACTLLGVETASAQSELIPCLPPEAPMTELPVEVLAEYRTEIAAEFEVYFAAISEHITCLDEERARAMDEARAATEAYTRLINTIPVRKDIP
jgi:hypothetical protein